MAALNLNYYHMVLLVSAIFAISASSSGSNMVLGQGCRGDMQGLVTECVKYVQKQGPVVDPSQACCDVIKSVDVPCLCSHVSKEIKDVIDMDKVVHVLGYCGKPLAHGMKCGSSPVP